MSENVPVDIREGATAATAIFGSLFALFARDNDVTSEEAGADKSKTRE
jgi:hypothetical protein